MTPKRERGLTLGTLGGVLLGFVSVTGGGYALATRAAEAVVGPHIAEARVRVRTMCVLARYQADAIEQMCRTLRAPCPIRPAELSPESLKQQCD